MDVREKLIEILRKTIFPHELVDPTEAVADYLLDSGVTVQEWLPVTARLPERGTEVVLIVHGWRGRLCHTGWLHRQEAERSWLTGIESKASDWKIWGFSYLREPIVTHWMPLPSTEGLE